MTNIQVAELVVSQNYSNWISFFTTLSAAFLGAYFAYLFNRKQQTKYEEQQNLTYLNYCIVILSQYTNFFYSTKEQVVLPRMPEIKFLNILVETFHRYSNLQERYENLPEEIKKEIAFDGHSIIIKKVLKECISELHDEMELVPVNIEKLNFINKRHPQIIPMLCEFTRMIDSLKNTRDALNGLLLKKDKAKMYTDIAFFQKLTGYTNVIAQKIDDCIYFSEKLAQLLIEFGRREYRNKFKLTVNINDEACKELKPLPIEEWEKVLKWPQKKTLKDKLINKINIVFKRGDNK